MHANKTRRRQSFANDVHMHSKCKNTYVKIHMCGCMSIDYKVDVWNVLQLQHWIESETWEEIREMRHQDCHTFFMASCQILILWMTTLRGPRKQNAEILEVKQSCMVSNCVAFVKIVSFETIFRQAELQCVLKIHVLVQTVFRNSRMFYLYATHAMELVIKPHFGR